MKAQLSVLALIVLCLASAAFEPSAAAQAPAAPPPAPVASTASTGVDTSPPTAVHATRAATPLAAPRLRDAHHDRLLFAPTAETHPKGSFYATSYYIVVLQLGYALSDSTQLSLTALPPLGDGRIVPGDISVKTVLWREPRVSIAAIGSASGVLGFDEFSGFLGRAGAVASFCADADECRLSISMSSNVALAGPASLLFNGVGASFRAGRWVSIVGELDTLIPLGEPVGQLNGILGGVAVRLSGRAWAVDLGMLNGDKAREEPTGLFPFLAATYRYVP